MDKKDIILLLCVTLIIATPFLLNNINSNNIGGTDDAAATEIQKSGYTPWFKSIWEPPSDDAETLIFGFQALIGISIMGFFIGYYRKKQNS